MPTQDGRVRLLGRVAAQARIMRLGHKWTQLDPHKNNSKVAGSYVGNKTMPEADMESLPDDVIFEILVRVPAHDIFDNARLLWPNWHEMIRTHDFARAHLQQSKHGLLIQQRGSNYDRPVFVATEKGRIQISNFNHKFAAGKVMSSCNGLVLDYFNHKIDEFYITNPATKRRIALPSFSTRMPPYNAAAIAYAAASMEYKVVRTIIRYVDNPESRGCAILTVGVDKDWTRRVNTQHLSLTAKNFLFSAPHPMTTQGFVHWTRMNCSECVLTLNVETEIITMYRVPKPLRRTRDGETKLLYHYLPMGSHLSMLIGDHTRFSWEVWMMKPETGEWTNMACIELEAEKCTFEGVSALNCRLVPVGWSKLGEVLVFKVFGIDSNHCTSTRFCVAYNVRTRETDSFELEYYGANMYIAHRNSLGWL